MTGLLASVSDLGEMRLARNGGADVVDLKQPAFGALGAWSTDALTSAVQFWSAWPHPRPLLSATAGDQPMVAAILRAAVERVVESGVPIIKVGFFASPHAAECIEALAPIAAKKRLVGVLFADQEPDMALLAMFGRAGFLGAMLDTADKKSGRLTHHLDTLTLGHFVTEARRNGLMTGLAGSLTMADIAPLKAVGADYLGFRGALCTGGREGRLDPRKLRAVRTRVTRAAPATGGD